MRKLPDHRYREVKSDSRPAVLDPLSEALAQLIDTGATDLSDVEQAYDISQDPTHKAILDAFLLSKMEFVKINQVLGVPLSVIEAYSHLFMDITVFRNKLEWMSYVQSYEGDDYGRDLVRVAMSIGPDYLMWTFGDRSTEIDTRQIVRRSTIDAFFRSLAHKGNTLTSGVAKEAKAWMSAAVKNAELLEKMDPRTSKNAAEELRIALQQNDDTLAPDQAPVPITEILR